MIFSEISHTRTADEVIHQIEELVLQGVLKPGDRIPGERALSKSLNVSRPVLREALQELEARKLLLTRPGEGTVVADVVGTVFQEPIVDLIRKHPKATADYVEFRRQIEGITAEMAASRATEADRELLTRLMDTMIKNHELQGFSAEAEVDTQFHQAIGECAHNIVLLHMLRSCYRLLEQGVFINRSRLYSHTGSRNALLAQHKTIYAAIMERDPQAARKAAELHMDFVAKAVQDVETVGAREVISRLRLAQHSTQTSSDPAANAAKAK
ncbi:MAG: FadR/GntR family transcriptional regulator [Hyphomicrobiales bacterium]